MPKIIENIRERILAEAEREVMEQGYGSLTIRSVAGALGIATGTIYNYFSSKLVMVACFMLKEWNTTMEGIRTACEQKCDYQNVLMSAYEGINTFCEEHQALFDDPEAKSGFTDAYISKRGLLIKQVADLFEPVCRESAVNYTEHTAEFLAESLMSWVMGHKDPEELYTITKSLFR